MQTLTEKEVELAELVIECLDLEDVEVTDIKPEAALFGSMDPDSLGLDSIDALEISLAIAKQYEVQLKADDSENKNIFASLRSLCDFIHSQN